MFEAEHWIVDIVVFFLVKYIRIKTGRVKEDYAFQKGERIIVEVVRRKKLLGISAVSKYKSLSYMWFGMHLQKRSRCHVKRL